MHQEAAPGAPEQPRRYQVTITNNRHGSSIADAPIDDRAAGRTCELLAAQPGSTA
jgi:hypothetical protein